MWMVNMKCLSKVLIGLWLMQMECNGKISVGLHVLGIFPPEDLNFNKGKSSEAFYLFILKGLHILMDNSCKKL